MAVKKAATAPMKRVKSWSPSAFNDYDQCSLQFQLGRLQKLNTGPKPAAFARGEDIHLKAEMYIKGSGRTLPKELSYFADLFKKLRKQYDKNDQIKAAIRVEENWGFTRDWDPCASDDWNRCWLRVKCDCAYFEGNVLEMPDWKTGKHRDDKLQMYMNQLEISAMACLLTYPRPDIIVRPSLHYLDSGKVYRGPADNLQYTLADLPRLKKVWEKRVAPMFADTVFKPKPGRACGFCYFRRSNPDFEHPLKCRF
jgi:hypothetical protein